MAQPGQLRIIGGNWRGRRLSIGSAPGLRPTPNRVRETLFNWLAPVIAGSRCLDLFAGSGALGLEALSRGAHSCLFVEQNPGVAAAIRANLTTLQAGAGQVLRADGVAALQRLPEADFDLVFLDPPFGRGLLEKALAELGPHLRASHRVYLEYTAEQPPTLPPGWQYLHRKQAGRVGYALASHASDSQDTDT